MTLTNRQRTDRLLRRLDELRLWTAREAIAIDGWSFGGKPLEMGAVWPTREGVVTIHRDGIDVPQEWPLELARLDVDLGGEGLLRIDYGGKADADAFGLDPNHQSFPLRHRTFSVSAQCVARLPFGVPNRAAGLMRARLVLIEPELDEFVLLLTQIAQTARELEGHDVTSPMLAAAEQAIAQIDWPSATLPYVARIAPGTEMQKVWQLPADLPETAPLNDAQRKSVADATGFLMHRLRELQKVYPQTGSLAMTGHAHIDLAWLWPLDETRRKANRTFSTMIGLMERNPEFVFNQSTAQLYSFLEEDDPELFAKIGEKVKSGQWEPIGAMWVEPDTNMPTGESFVRQLLYGQRYFEKTFGKRHTVCWLPDCFGFTPALPQLLQGAGVTKFFTIKVNWSERNSMPHDLFIWEGLDGSRVLAHTFNNPVGGYNAEISPRAVLETWKNYRGKHRRAESLISYGYGDGGGGPTQDMLDRARQFGDFPVVPKMRPVKVEDWFNETAAIVQDQADLPVWLGEIYLELHRGTLTTQGKTKYLHRHAERALITAEVLGSMAAMLGAKIPASLEDQWRIVLRNEFHDILPGSSIREVYQLAEAELSSVIAAGKDAAKDHIGNIAGSLAKGGAPAVLAINPDLSERPLRLFSEGALPGSQKVEGGHVLTGAAVPPLSAVVRTTEAAPGSLRVDATGLENDFVRVELAADGTLASVFDKRAGRETLDGRGNQIWAYVDKPRNWDAWDVEENYATQGEEILATAPHAVVETGPHRASIRVTRRFRDSTITQHVRLWANSPRLDIATEIDWHERRFLLKARFPLAIRADHATFECAHGVIRRPTHRNTSWDEARFEVVAHRFADLSEYGYGVALLNDGKYGHHAFGNELGLSLLRSPVYPDPLADEGRQSFTYSLLPHQGDWLTGGVLAEAEDLNQPMPCLAVKADADRVWTAAKLDGLQLGLSALKPAEDGGHLILRSYEPAGARGKVRVELAEGWALGRELDLLEDETGKADTSFLPFKLHSWAIQQEK